MTSHPANPCTTHPCIPHALDLARESLLTTCTHLVTESNIKFNGSVYQVSQTAEPNKIESFVSEELLNFVNDVNRMLEMSTQCQHFWTTSNKHYNLSCDKRLPKGAIIFVIKTCGAVHLGRALLPCAADRCFHTSPNVHIYRNKIAVLIKTIDMPPTSDDYGLSYCPYTSKYLLPYAQCG